MLESDLRAGPDAGCVSGAHTRLEAMDLSMLRAGQKSGAVGPMFGFMADNYEGPASGPDEADDRAAGAAAIAFISLTRRLRRPVARPRPVERLRRRGLRTLRRDRASA